MTCSYGLTWYDRSPWCKFFKDDAELDVTIHETLSPRFRLQSENKHIKSRARNLRQGMGERNTIKMNFVLKFTHNLVLRSLIHSFTGFRIR